MKYWLHIFLVFILFFQTYIVDAQQNKGITFGGEKIDRAFSIQRTIDNHLLIIGASSSFSSSMDVYVIKADTLGNIIWERNFGDTREELGWNCIEMDNGERYLLTGFTLPFGGHGETTVMMKITRDGRLVWSKYIDQNDSRRTTNITHLQDGNAVLIGQHRDPSDKKLKGCLLKIDTSSQRIWEQQYASENYSRLFYAAETSKNDILATGIARQDTLGENHGWILIADKNGKQKKSILLTSIRNTTPHGLVKVAKDKFLITGYAQEDSVSDQRSLYLCMTNGKGKILFEKTIRDPNRICHGIAATKMQNGHIAITGYAKQFSGNHWNGILYVIEQQGLVVRREEFGGGHDDMPYSIVEYASGKLAIAGLTESYGKGLSDLWLVFF